MSANNQILIKKYKKKYFVFEVMAESWSKTNPLRLSEAIKSFNTFEKAFKFGNKYTWDFMGIQVDTEYGVGTKLIKDGANVKIINDLVDIKESK